MDDELMFADEEPEVDGSSSPDVATERKPWVLLVVDDEKDVHQVTRMALGSFSFDGRGLEFLHAHSAEEARAVLAERDDVGLALIDVVMETEHAGLDLARWIRETHHDPFVRLVMRTGQPGSAPESDVIQQYDIHDYKEKTELTKKKLETLLYSGFRAYRDIRTIAASLQGLERTIAAITQVSEARSLSVFASAVLDQITILLDLPGDGLCLGSVAAWAANVDGEREQVLAATGKLARLLEPSERPLLPEHVKEAFTHVDGDAGTYHGDSYFVGRYTTPHGAENLLYIEHSRTLSPLERHLLELYGSNVAITYESLLLKREVEETQKELVYLLGEAVERRSKETGSHVRRVGLIAGLLAGKMGVGAEMAQLISLAAPLHDAGKVGIPDSVLNKPGKLDADEWEVMKSHASIGYELLRNSPWRVPALGAIIAQQHHERWNGRGYPTGPKGTEIHIAARVTAIADVFDALLSKRCYKEPWPLEKALDLIQRERGEHFDPDVVDCFMNSLTEIVAIRAAHPD